MWLHILSAYTAIVANFIKIKSAAPAPSWSAIDLFGISTYDKQRISSASLVFRMTTGVFLYLEKAKGANMLDVKFGQMPRRGFLAGFGKAAVLGTVGGSSDQS